MVRAGYLPRGVFIQETLMSGTLPLTPDQLDEFDRRGVLRLRGLICADRVRRAREYVQRRLVEPRGGGTLVVAGSHRLLNEGRFVRVNELRQLLCREAFFRNLYSEGQASVEDSARLLEKTSAMADVALEVVELTGSPGDAYLTDLRLLHTAAPNATDCPRMMATHRFVREDVMKELAEGFGWVPARTPSDDPHR
jgi:hypothetical protein